MPIFDGQLSAIAAELEGCDPEECQVQVRGSNLNLNCAFCPPCTSSALLLPNSSLQSRIYNLRDTKVIRDLNPADINKLIGVSGMVTRTSGVIPDQRQAGGGSLRDA